MQVKQEAEGVIDPDRLYSLDAFKRATRWTANAIRTARRNGLPVKYVGRQGWILGRDFISHVTEQGRAEHYSAKGDSQ